VAIPVRGTRQSGCASRPWRLVRVRSWRISELSAGGMSGIETLRNMMQTSAGPDRAETTLDYSIWKETGFQRISCKRTCGSSWIVRRISICWSPKPDDIRQIRIGDALVAKWKARAQGPANTSSEDPNRRLVIIGLLRSINTAEAGQKYGSKGSSYLPGSEQQRTVRATEISVHIPTTCFIGILPYQTSTIHSAN
jgi:hypothetical protein